MKVSGIFKVLIVIVVCVMLGGLLINTLVPNAATTVVDAAEVMIFKATGISFNFNGNTFTGKGSGFQFEDTTEGKQGSTWVEKDVEGFTGGVSGGGGDGGGD